MVHDASTGFHDIKPIPVFSPLPLKALVAAALMICVLSLCLWLLRRKFPDKARTVAVPPPPTPIEVALAQFDSLLRDVQSQSVSLRDLGTRSSLALRAYFGTLLQIPGTDLTTKEFLEKVQLVLRQSSGATLPPKAQEDLLRRAGEVLRFCEWVTFSSQSEARYADDRGQLAKRISDARALVVEDDARRVAERAEAERRVSEKDSRAREEAHAV